MVDQNLKIALEGMRISLLAISISLASTLTTLASPLVNSSFVTTMDYINMFVYAVAAVICLILAYKIKIPQ